MHFMYSLIYNNKQAVIIIANERGKLNEKTNKAEDIIFNKYGDWANFDESRNYDDDRLTVNEIFAKNPKIKDLEIVDAKNFEA